MQLSPDKERAGLDEKQLNKVHKLLNYNKKLKNDPLIDRALAEVELAKKASPLVGSQEDQEKVLARMGIHLPGTKQRSSEVRKDTPEIAGTNSKKEKLLQRASKYINLRNQNQREAPDYLALAKAPIGSSRQAAADAP